MPDNITQTFSIDAGQALATIAQLDKEFQRLGNSIGTLAGQIKTVNGVSKGIHSMGAAFTQAVPPAVKQTERLTTSLGLLSRITFTQGVIRGLNLLRRTINETAGDAVEFQKQVALITTIGDGAQFGQIADQVKRLSNEFNIPLLETAEGLYNALSNQVGDFGQSVKFSEEAARFAKATNSSLKDSVDLLSAALKGYGLGVEDVDKVSSIFFATIDKGRINASELANSFGRVDTIAADLGVSLEETGGALAAISVRGTKTSEALTQFRAILSALQKPSKAMEKTLAEMGFTSSEVAIKTLGLSGLLGKLADSTGGSAEEMAKLFRNIRGLSGVTSLTSDDLKSLADNVNEMTQAGREFNQEKFLQATQTDAERVTKELNKLRNELTTGVGVAALSVADDLFKLTGGADSLIAAAKVAIPTIGAVGGAMLSLHASTKLAEAGFGGLAKAVNGLALAGVAFGVGQSIGNFLEQQRLDAAFKDLRTLEAQDKAFLAKFEANQKEQRDAFNRTNETRVQAALQANLELARIYNQDVANARNAEERKAAFDKFKAKSAVDENLLGAVLKRKIDSPDQVARGIIDAQKRAAELKAQFDQALSGEQGIETARREIDGLFKSLEDRAGSRAMIGGERGEGLRGQFANVLNLLKNLRNDANITEAELSKVIDFRNKLGQDALPGLGLPGSGKGGILGSGVANIEQAAFATSINQLDAILAKFVQIKTTKESIGDTGSIESELVALETVLEQAAPDIPFQAATSALQSGVVPAQAIEAAMVGAANAAERITAAQLKQPVGRMFGGPGYFANGGRGTDTIPAMLSKGEFVVNPKSSQRFFSQLQAMNAGKKPVFRQDGGSVTNIGDVSITVKDSGSPSKTARAVMREFRREQRRGTGRL